MPIEESMIYLTSTSVGLMAAYALNKSHVISHLIIIEFTIMMMVLLLFSWLGSLDMENYVSLYIIILAIAESVIGLSLMINMIRTHGNDFIKSSVSIKL